MLHVYVLFNDKKGVDGSLESVYLPLNDQSHIKYWEKISCMEMPAELIGRHFTYFKIFNRYLP